MKKKQILLLIKLLLDQWKSKTKATILLSLTNTMNLIIKPSGGEGDSKTEAIPTKTDGYYKKNVFNFKN